MLLPLLLAMAAPEGPPIVGGDADAHGCRASAGYVWSPLAVRCLRLFEDGVRLDPVKPAGSAVISAFAVFAAKDSAGPAELWLPGARAPLRLAPHHGQWRGHGWVLVHKGKQLEVRHGRERAFAGTTS